MNLNDDVVYRCLRLGPLSPAVPAAWSVTTIAFMTISPRSPVSSGGNVGEMEAGPWVVLHLLSLQQLLGA